MPERKLAVIDVKPGSAMESQSGLQMKAPRIFGAYEKPEGTRRTACIVMHPTSNFMGHYLISPLARRGICCLGLNSRYVGSDTTLLMERVVQDLGAGVRFLQGLGYEQVFLVGNSGGGALAAFYQAQAERLTVTRTPDGTPIAIEPSDLPPAAGIVLTAAHAGRSRLMEEWIDPSVVQEDDPLSGDPELDVYNPVNGPGFSPDWIERFRAAQRARRDRIEAWAWRRLRQLRATPGAPPDMPFLIHRTQADPRLLDLSLDANDREAGSIWGPARDVNYAANAMGRITTLTAFLSQWASCSQADGPTNLARTGVPVLLLEHTADGSTFPSTRDAWMGAAGDRAELHRLVGANHYLSGQPVLVEEAADRIAAWAARF
ncbi:alpha/beta hydrolase [Roseomonas populi]|uniref:Alpha/beta hydrolase n=1 Tax=Roseomonas populi TaxID=3121582 RepID=A0ABT1XA75_9PROT|nr:alpha/beta hydrolase [Roseomonas pecuniae]MCR0985004.1 alpha/beta hydrolase [Roseomonas pecuniae]